VYHFPHRPLPEDSCLSGKSIDGLATPTIFSCVARRFHFISEHWNTTTQPLPRFLDALHIFLKLPLYPYSFPILTHGHNQSVWVGPCLGHSGLRSFRIYAFPCHSLSGLDLCYPQWLLKTVPWVKANHIESLPSIIPMSTNIFHFWPILSFKLVPKFMPLPNL